MTTKKIFVLDTNVLIHEPTAFLSFEEHDVIIPMTVIEELDRLKDGKGTSSHEARHAIKAIESVFTNSTPEEMTSGVKMPSHDAIERGLLSLLGDMEITKSALENDGLLSGFYSLDKGDPDFQIMLAAKAVQDSNPDKEVVLVTKDICMRLRGKRLGIREIQDYTTDQVVSDVKYLAKGYIEFEGDFWEHVSNAGGNVESFNRDGNLVYEFDKSIIKSPYINQYILDDSKKVVLKIVAIEEDKIIAEEIGYNKLMNVKAWGVSPRNINQALALDALLDDDISLVSITGPAGSGKSFLTIAAAIHMCLEKNQYDKIIVTRSTPEIAESIGYLPGDEKQKMLPWLASISDSLEALHKKDADGASSIEYIIEKANIQFKSLNFMRGRSIQNCILILDEAQNLTPSQMKTIITRCALNTKIIILGNNNQIDSPLLNAITSGLSTTVEKFKMFEGASTINLKGVVRSKLASFAEENL